MPTKTEAKAARREMKPAQPFPQTFGLGFLLIVVVTLIAYGPAFKAGFIWDDNDMLTENHLIKAANGLGRIWAGEFVDYFPLTMSSLWLEWRIWGMNAKGYHVTNILLHALSAVLFWRILLRLKIPGAFWAAFIFAVHPVNVESVAWITERKNTLSLFFGALSVLFFVRFEQPAPGNPASVKKEKQRWYIVSLAAFALSLLAKTATVMLPVVLVGLIWWKSEREQGRKGAEEPAAVAPRHRFSFSPFLRTIPFFALSGVMALVTIWFQYNRAIEKAVVNTSSFPERIIIAGRAVWFYLGKALVPLKLTFVYPRWEIDAGNVVNFLPAIAVIAVLIALFLLRKKLGSAPLLGFGYFVLTLFPVLGFFNIYFHKYSFVADHWQYVSLIGIIALIAAALAHFLKAQAQAVSGVLVAVLAVLTFQQTKIYKNQETLWRDTLKKNPTCSMAEGNWGFYLFNQNRLPEAIQHYEAALKMRPDDHGTMYNYGVALLQLDRREEAIEKFQQVLKLNPDHKLTLLSLAWVRSIDKNPALRNGGEAVRLAEHGVKLTNEKDEWMLDTLAAAYAENGRFDEAVRAEMKAMEVATKKGDIKLADEMGKRLQMYKSGIPFHEE